MAKLRCPISGLLYACDHIPITCSIKHPIFTLQPKKLIGLYARYTKNDLSPTDSYLLLLALLNTIDSLEWRVPCALVPTATATAALIANNIAQLVVVLEKTNAITVPSFTQPGYVINYENSDLSNLPVYIKAWKSNILDFHFAYKEDKILAKTRNIEATLQKLINNGEDRLSSIKLADWAHLCASFPVDKEEHYKKLIRSCYNQEKMFKYKIPEIEEVRDYCLAYIEPGSIYSYALHKVLEQGMQLNKSYLGYTLLDTASLGSSSELAILAAKAPEELPLAQDYATSTEFLKAKLRYNVAQRLRATTATTGAK